MSPPIKRRLRGAPSALMRRSRRLLGDGRGSAAEAQIAFDASAPELLLSPHWDDAVLSCWSTLGDGRALTVLNVFAGLPPAGRSGPWEALAGLADSRERARGRAAEDERALARVGHTPINLDLPEARSRSGSDGVSPRRLHGALARAVPAASRVYAPAAIGGHPDHALVRRLALELLASGIPVSLYADFPYCIAHGWPAWVLEAGEAQGAPLAAGEMQGGDVDAYWQSFLRDVPEMPPLHAGRVVRLDDATAAAKLEAIGCYRLSLNLSVREMLAAGGFYATEVLWELSAG